MGALGRLQHGDEPQPDRQDDPDADEFTLDTAAELAEPRRTRRRSQGRSPWYLAWRRLRRNYVALLSLGVFILIVVACALAPRLREARRAHRSERRTTSPTRSRSADALT